MATLKTTSYLLWRLENELPGLWERIPKQNHKYKDVRADYRRLITEDALRGLTQQNAQVIIKMIEDRDEKGVENFIWGLTGLTN